MQIWNTIVILATTLVFAEPQSEVTLIDGSQLVGEVTELSDDNLKFTSDGQTKALAIELQGVRTISALLLSVDDAVEVPTR